MPDPIQSSGKPLAPSLGKQSFALLLLLAVGVLAGPGAVGQEAPLEIHVAPQGSDANPGTRDQPLQSLEAAREAVRARLRDMRSGNRARAPITVLLASGDHRRNHALLLGPEDSGAPGAPVTWTAAPNATVRLLGGTTLLHFQPVTDPALRARLPAEARAQVVTASAEFLDSKDPATLASRGFGRGVQVAHPELFHGGRPMPLARWPNEGTFTHIAGFPQDRAQGDDHGGSIGTLPAGFTLDTDRPRRWADLTNVWVHGYWAWDWANSYERITSFDPATRLLRTAPPHGLYGFRQGQRIHFVNVLEELDAPGEWHLDRAAQRVCFWPPPETRAAETLLSSLAEPFLRLQDASHVEIRGLLLEATRATGIEIVGGTSNQVVSCLLRNLGNHGVDVQGGSHHAILACDILDTGDGGVSLTGGDRTTLRPSGHVVANCRFQRQGRWSKCYVPAIHLQGVGHRAAHNLIQDHPHCAILYWGNDHLIEFNEIHHVALETGDVGAIYTGRDYTFRGNRILHNFIHHVGGVGMGSMGAYMDDCVSGTEIRGNVFHHVQRAAFLGGGRDHLVANNVFVDCHHAVELDGRGLDRSPVWRSMVDETMRSRLNDVPLELYRQRYPELKSLDAAYGPPGGPALTGTNFLGVPPSPNRVERNVCVGPWLRTGWNATTNHLHLEANLVTDDPRFVAPLPETARATDFALRPDSPAWALGFQAIPLSRIGLQPDP
ncbi:MAG: right-handed parallel beta-helix repeat-containing protein, partial [Verrucomicrobiales bacterium]|nr:right-handed parallel beta-helix repeat-containing protein [Verrucomicrobiales bacterium]